MGRKMVWMPTPHVKTILPKDREETVDVVAVDSEPMTLAAFDGEEAPKAFTLTSTLKGTSTTYRIADERLWRPIVGREGPWTPDNAADMMTEALEGMLRTIAPQAMGDSGILPSLVSRSPERPGIRRTMAVREEMANVVAENEAEKKLASRHIQTHVAVIDGTLHHEAPEPVLVLEDPASTGRLSIQVRERPWEEAFWRDVPSFPGPDGVAPWLTFPVHGLREAKGYLEWLGERSGAPRGRAETDLDVVVHAGPAMRTGGPQHDDNGYRIASADGLVEVLKDTIGWFPDDAIFVFIETRRSLAALGPRRDLASVRKLPPEAVARVVHCLDKLAELMGNARAEHLGPARAEAIRLAEAAAKRSHADTQGA